MKKKSERKKINTDRKEEKAKAGKWEKQLLLLLLIQSRSHGTLIQYSLYFILFPSGLTLFQVK